VNLSEWAERVGVSKFTAYRWFREGTLPVPATRAGRLILVDVDGPRDGAGRTVVYARVSSHGQRDDLDRQVARMTQWATGQAL
jgi:putative resolvase